MTQYAPGAARASGRLDDQLFIACGLAWAAGLLHAVAAPPTVPIGLLAAAQICWGVALYRRPSRALLAAGAALSLAAAGAWIASRVGSPVGPVDSVAATDEIVLALVALSQLRRGRGGRVARGLRMGRTTVCLYLILLSSLMLMPGPAQGGVKGSLAGVPRAGFELLCHAG